jgi:hypothetical protein
MRSLRWLLLLALASGMAAACFRPQVQSARVDESVPVPATIGVFPILSSIEVHRGYPHPPRYERFNDRIIVTPPAEMTMAVTPESRMLSNAFSVALQQQGFGLRELPVEQLEGDTSGEGGGVDRYGISLELLGRLRGEFGLMAIVVGDAYFLHRYNGTSAPAIAVVAAHVRVIDTATLEVIAQVDMPYDASGADISAVARELAAEMSRMGEQVAAAPPPVKKYDMDAPYPAR